MLKQKNHLVGNKKHYSFANVKQKQNVLQAFFAYLHTIRREKQTALQCCACNRVQAYFLVWVRFYVCRKQYNGGYCNPLYVGKEFL